MKSEFLESIQNALMVNAGEDSNLAHLISAIKDLNPNVLGSLAELKHYFKHYHNRTFNIDNIKDNKKILKLAFWYEMGKKMLYEGNTPQEIITEIGIPPDMLESIVKNYVAKLPPSVLQFMLLLERQKRLAADVLGFFKNHVIEDLKAHDQDILAYFEKQVALNPFEKNLFEGEAFRDLDDL